MSNSSVNNVGTLTNSTPASNHMVDLDSVLGRLDGDVELFQDFIAIFMEDAPALMKEIDTALNRADAPALQQSSHALKGLLLNFGAKQCVEAALALERAGRAGEIGNAEEDYEKLLVSFEALRDELETLQTN